MANERTDLHQLLMSLFPQNSEPHVYYEPPQSIRLKYPCIIYKLDNLPGNWANNLPYKWWHSYNMTYITQNEVDPMIDKLRGLRKTMFNRSYVADNLHHYVFTIFS